LKLIDVDAYRSELWELCEEIFLDKPTNYEFNRMLELLDTQPTIESKE
jgi:hypothetical protein